MQVVVRANNRYASSVKVEAIIKTGDNAMATTKSQHNAKDRSTDSKQHVESPQEITHDIVEYFTDYARQNPGYAALACIGVGFVLGWKLKPW
jgi:hypothetical protein